MGSLILFHTYSHFFNVPLFSSVGATVKYLLPLLSSKKFICAVDSKVQRFCLIWGNVSSLTNKEYYWMTFCLS